MNESMRVKKEGLDFCDQLDLRGFEHIQSYGVLLVLNDNLVIVQCSENTPEILDSPVTDLLGRSALDFFKSEFIEDNIRSWLSAPVGHPRRALFKKIPVFMMALKRSDGILVTIERNFQNHKDDVSLFDVTQRASSMIRKSMKCTTIESLCHYMCDEIKKITHYERVLIYRFNEHDQAGVVVGETISDGMESYLGLHFPPNDVPKSVREMYMKMPMRYIPNRLDEPVKLTPEKNPVTGQATDLSLLNIRMVAPVHVTYMKNMSICSSVSVPIVRDNRLWGLIACHHRESHTLSANIRVMLPVIANMIAAKSESIEAFEDLQNEETSRALQAALSLSLKGTKTLAEALEEHNADLMKMISATGMSFYDRDIILSYGDTPQEQDVLELIAWLDNNLDLTTYHTTILPEVYPPSFAYKDIASGLLAIRITPTRRQYLLFYKPEYIDTVVWAGNPCHAVQFHDQTYSPRASFDRFIVNSQNQSRPWSKHEITSATLIHSLIATKELQEMLENEVLHDPLTQLLNRRQLEKSLTLEIHRSSRESKPLSVLILDIDYLKEINDTLGHLAGDALLKGFSELITKQFRPYDYIYRYGGDEFLVVFPNVTLKDAVDKANELRENVKKLRIDLNDITLPPTSVTIGVSVYPENGMTAKSLISSADDALYRAKKEGRDRVLF